MTGCVDENVFTAFLEGTLADDERRALHAHLARCADCRKLVAVAGPPEQKLDLKRGTSLGRYVVLDPIGVGAMGAVYSAYDPQLDRRVALKLLHSSGRSDASTVRPRLQREAQALARLSHPNVVAVYDVGAVEEQLFVAMEFVDGETLAAWLSPGRTGDEILRVFTDAGRGLAAAHRSGLLHRDFKPENVLVGRDGRVRVTDFGLARALGEPSSPGEPTPPGLLGTTLTRTGALVGTPAYMAPEQLAGEPLDARTDEFSFSVSLYEALCSERPFRGATPGELLESIRKGPPDPRPKVRVSPRVRNAVLRGLAAKPELRFPAMDALIAELARPPLVTAARLFAVAGVAFVLAVSGTLAWRSSQRQTMCKGAERALVGVWDPQVRRDIHAAFVGTGKPYAEDAARAVTSAIDVYAQRWVAVHTDACEATRLRGDQSEGMLDRRMDCLARRLQGLSALTHTFAKADAQIVERGLRAAQALEDLAGCSDRQALEARVVAPADAATRARVEAVRAQLADGKALMDSGRYADGFDVATKALSQAELLHYRPLEAEALYLTGLLRGRLDAIPEAEALLKRAARAAEAGHEDDLAARSWVELVRVAPMAHSPERADEYVEQSKAAIERAGEPELLLAALENYEGSLMLDRAKLPEASEHYGRALALRERGLGSNDPLVGSTLNNLCLVHGQQGDYAKAQAECERAVAIWESAVGPAHPDVANARNTLAATLEMEGRYTEAEQQFRRSLEILKAALGENHPDVATGYNNLGNVLAEQGEYDKSAVELSHAAAIAEQLHGPNDTSVAVSLSGLGGVLLLASRPAEALPITERAIAIQDRLTGRDHANVADTLDNLGQIHLALGKAAEARADFERAVKVRSEAYGDDYPKLGSSLTGLGQSQLALGATQAAVAILERALKLREAHPGDPAETADTQFQLARALSSHRAAGPRIRTLIASARDAYVKAGKPRTRDLAALDGWVASHP